MNMYELEIILHIIGVAVIVGVNFIVIYAVYSKEISNGVLKLLKSIQSQMPLYLGLIVVSGGYMYLYSNENFGDNNLFWAKMIFFVLDLIVIAGLVESKLKAAKTEKEIETAYKKTNNFRLISMGLQLLMVALGMML